MKIRQGKDIILRWKITTNGEALPLEGRNLTLILSTPNGRERVLSYTTEGDTISTRLFGKEITLLGDYTLTLWENRGEQGQTAVDAVNAFELVKYTTMEDGNSSCGNLEAETVDLGVTDMIVGIEGPQGPVGPQGEKGDKGDVGPQGPQGPQGEKVPVVNDLTTGGTDKALSAEMGKMLGISVEELKERVHDLGDFGRSGQAEAEAGKAGIAGNPGIVLIRYTVGNENGIILQQVGETTTKQILFWGSTQFQRHINFSSSDKTSVSSTSSWWKMGATHTSYDAETRRLHLQDMNYINLNPSIDAVLPLASKRQNGLMTKGQVVELGELRQELAAHQNDAIAELTNGNLKLTLKGITKEFMPATPSGDPMHYAYVSAGAEYNATDGIIVVDAPWKNLVDPIAYKAQWNLDIVDDNLVQSDSITCNGVSYRYAKDTRTSPTDGTRPRYRIVTKDDTTGKWVWDDTKVLHLPNHWHLNGLGDITNGEMREIYRIEKKDMSSGVYMLYWRQSTLRTATVRQGSYGAQSTGYSVCNNVTIEVVNFDTLAIFNNDVVGSPKIRHIISNTNRLTLEYMTKTISKGTFSTQNLVTCNLRNLTQSISMDESPNLSRATIIQLISKATPTSAITITLHHDAYERLKGDADILQALTTKNADLANTGDGKGKVSLVCATDNDTIPSE